MAALLATGYGCGSSSDAPKSNGGSGGATACVPGIQIACVCTNGADGAQACKADGSGYGACVCSPSGAGGMSAGGSSGAGAIGGHPSAGSSTSGEGGEAGGSEAGAGGEAGATNGTASDFPKQPILVDGAPANAPELFAAATDTSTKPLCVLEPQLSADTVPGAMFPSNWLRPRFRVAAADFDLYEIRLHSAAESNDLVVYTKQKTWYLPKGIWRGSGVNAGLSVAASGGPVSVTIRALNSSTPQTAARVSGSFNIAPAVASGSILFPTAAPLPPTPDGSKVLGFSIGDEGVQSALTLPQLAWSGQFVEDGVFFNGYYDRVPLAGFANGQVRRIYRPVLTPDNQALAFGDEWPYALAMAQLTGGTVGSIPTYVGTGAQGMLRMSWLGSPTFSAAHWAPKDRILVSSYGTTFTSGKARNNPWQSLPAYVGTDGATADDLVKWHQLAWFDLEASFAVPLTELDYGTIDTRYKPVTAAKGSSWGLIATGDANVSNVTPSFNPAGDKLAYVATDYSPLGFPDSLATKADIRVVPYNSHNGGASQALVGASDANYFEYEPSFSPDGKLVAFSRAATGGPDGPFRNRYAELSVVPATGGERARLVANDPNACASDPTPLALLNGSPAWGPNPVHQEGRTYYFLIFTSARKYGDEFSTQFELADKQDTAGTHTDSTLSASTQLYLTTIVVDDASGSITSYPAIYIWNQNRVPGSVNGFSARSPVWGSTILPPQNIPPVP
ncbi:MAG TPA: hypothetical protein VER96_19880 [Polyangiaceae bacterium]|nr:hypothetical protein [Polyangiaceae bacterium]